MKPGAGSGVLDGNMWRFIVDRGLRGCSNMARDEALAVGVAGGAPPALRVYRFEPPAISIGRFQEIGREIDPETCREKGVEVVRRPTGGLAILHADDFTYSVTIPSGDSGFAAKERCYNRVAAGILESLRRLGVSARLSRHVETGEAASIWCLQSAFGVDLELDGRKICGSAQRMFPRAILQHGTLFLKDNRELKGRITRGGPLTDERTGPLFVTLAEACGREIVWEEVKAAFQAGFAGALGITLEDDALCEEEETLARRLMVNKYGGESWTGGGEADAGLPAL